ncbi:MAG: hypothetical protein ACF8GE_01495 [Phycisphaerales bacterium JB043]
MLVSLEDNKGGVCWVNPIYVREIKPTRAGSKLVFGGGKTVQFSIGPDELATRLNVGMPVTQEELVAMIDTQHSAQQSQAAGAASTSLG